MNIMGSNEKLNDVMSIDHVIEVTENGTVIDRTDLYAPECSDDSEGTTVSGGWELLTGWTGQHGYRGPVMHPSEFIGGRLEQHILETPGVYVVLVPSDGEGDLIDGWVIARKI